MSVHCDSKTDNHLDQRLYFPGTLNLTRLSWIPTRNMPGILLYSSSRCMTTHASRLAGGMRHIIASKIVDYQPSQLSLLSYQVTHFNPFSGVHLAQEGVEHRSVSHYSSRTSAICLKHCTIDQSHSDR